MACGWSSCSSRSKWWATRATTPTGIVDQLLESNVEEPVRGRPPSSVEGPVHAVEQTHLHVRADSMPIDLTV